MAQIEYRIMVDSDGNATVIQDVQVIDPGDRIRFVSNDSRTVIRVEGRSPCEEIPTGKPVPVQEIGSNPPFLTVTTTNTGLPKIFSPQVQQLRSAFPIKCGSLDAKGGFTVWGGDGPITPSGGSDL